MLAQRQRWLLLGGALLLTLLLAAGIGQPESGNEAAVVEPVTARPRGSRAAPPAELQIGSLASLPRELGAGKVRDLFPVQSWYVPPPPPKPAPPKPPPLPFTYLGKAIDDGMVSVFVAQGDRNLVVKTGDVIDGVYRADSILPPVMTFTYLPLQMQQTLEIGVAN
ncbi:hypothetical protein [Vogesella alkaliphila]|uniref:Secretion system X translation initiation factor n=1 Tax=Vogesella alkaliphila TaxID=1193621 RepID=A0ABQ2YS00_9NEIS|nr:hypothetical protein [Vogesella alkaliphila]GGX90560.1 hypothetical protein GCM10011290_17850 [Vogesella alkaliphila]